MRRPRIAIYSHDALGLGHLRRNHLIASVLASAPTSADVLLLSGARELNAFALPSGVDVLTLPAFRKNGDSDYSPRELSLSARELGVLRSRLLRLALEEIRPDLLIVDKLPLGLQEELLPALREIRGSGHTRCVLGLRDILDEPGAVRREWSGPGGLESIRSFYDQIWIYGDRSVYDSVLEYEFPDDVAEITQFTGYLDPRRRIGWGEPITSNGNGSSTPRAPYVLCELGGGQDGGRVAECFLRSHPPDGIGAVLLCGPFMPRVTYDRLEEVAAQRPSFSLVGFQPDTSALRAGAERVICMGGYNTMMEVVCTGRPALVVPRTVPRREQSLRAERFAALGLVDVLPPEEISSRALTDWMAAPVVQPLRAELRLDIGGLERISELVDALLPLAVGASRDGVRASAGSASGWAEGDPA